MRIWINIITAIILLVGVGVIVSSSKKKISAKPAVPISAPGSIREGEPVSKHFKSVLDRLSYDKFRVTVKFIPPIDHEVYLHPGGTMITLLILDSRSNEILDISKDITERIAMLDTQPNKDGRVRGTSRTFKVNTTKLPKGSYIVSARVEVCEEGKKATLSKTNFLGSMTTIVHGHYKLVVK